MKIGIAGMRPGHERLVKIASDIGYSFIETSLSALEKEFSEEQIREFAAHNKSIGMPCVSVNGMFPSDIKLIGLDADRGRIEDYLHRAFEKIESLGVEVCVLGSGGARNTPEGYSLDQAYDEFIDLISETIEPVVSKYGKTLAIEPLNYSECNIVNTVADSMRVVRAVNKPRVMTLIDYYHVRYNGEDIDSFVDHKGYIRHVHVASKNNNRRFPMPTDGENYKKFFDVLRKAGYTYENISLEASYGSGEISFKNYAIAAYSLLSKL